MPPDIRAALQERDVEVSLRHPLKPVRGEDARGATSDDHDFRFGHGDFPSRSPGRNPGARGGNAAPTCSAGSRHGGRESMHVRFETDSGWGKRPGEPTTIARRLVRPAWWRSLEKQNEPR